MILQNVSASVLTLAGQYTVNPAQTVTIPYKQLLSDDNLVSYIDSQQIVVQSAEESLTLGELPRFTQGTIVPAQTLTAGQTLIPTTNNGQTNILLWVAPFQIVRLYLLVTAGDMTVTLSDSPDGGTTFFSMNDLPTLTTTATTSNGVTTPGKDGALLPKGLCLLQFSLSSVNGGTGQVFYSRQASE